MVWFQIKYLMSPLCLKNALLFSVIINLLLTENPNKIILFPCLSQVTENKSCVVLATARCYCTNLLLLAVQLSTQVHEVEIPLKSQAYAVLLTQCT